MRPLIHARIAASGAAIAFSAIQISLIALYPMIAERTQLSLPQVILSFSLGSLLFLWASPFWGKFSDQNGRKPALVVGLTGLALSLGVIVYLFGSHPTPFSLAILMTSRILYGLTASAIAPVAQAIQCDSEESARHRALSRHTMNLAIGRVVGLLVFAQFSQYSSQTLSIIFGLLVIGLVGVTQIRFAPASHPNIAVTTTTSVFSKSTWLAPSFLLVFAFAVIIECLNSIFSKTIRDRLSLTSAEGTAHTAALLLSSAIVILLTQIAFRKYAQKLDTLTMAGRGLKFGSVMLGLGVCGFVAAHQKIEIWAALTILSVGIGTIPPSYLALITHHDSSARTAGRISAIQTLGYFVGGMTASLALQWNADAPYAVLLIVTAALVSQVWMFTSVRKASSV